MAPATSSRSTKPSRRRQCRTGRRFAALAVTPPGEPRISKRRPRHGWRPAPATVRANVRCMAMITPGPGRAGFRRPTSSRSGARLAAPAGRSDMPTHVDTPRLIRGILGWPWLWPVVRLALVSAFLIGGVTKLLDFSGAIAEQEHFALRPGWLWASLAI